MRDKIKKLKKMQQRRSAKLRNWFFTMIKIGTNFWQWESRKREKVQINITEGDTITEEAEIQMIR